MTLEFVSCPRCGEPVDPQIRDCVYCGVNLALAALLAERDITAESIHSGNIPISPEILVPRLGDYLIEKGVLNPADLQKALDHQAALEADGQTCLIGETLLELGLVDKETLDQVITEQILQLQSALQQTNMTLENRVRERTAELEKALNRLAELNQLKSNFIANISHELRTPLTHIKGYLELLIEGGLGILTTEQSDALQVMTNSEERLEQLIEDLIQFSLVARGQLDLRIVPVNLDDILEEAVQGSRQRCDKANLSLVNDFPQRLPLVSADHAKIIWVLNQLLDNAIKFTPSGGEIQFRVEEGENRVTLSILDTGIGIAPDRFDEIFELFHQLDNSATRRYGGTGLGLALVKKIVEAHGSTIQVNSSVGEGSKFTFSLPIVRSSRTLRLEKI